MHTTERGCRARRAKVSSRGTVIKCSPGFFVRQPWVLGLLAQVVWLTQSGPRTGAHFPPITTPCGCMALKCTLMDVDHGAQELGPSVQLVSCARAWLST